MTFSFSTKHCFRSITLSHQMAKPQFSNHFFSAQKCWRIKKKLQKCDFFSATLGKRESHEKRTG